MGALRLTGTEIVPSTGFIYSVGALDPHFSAVYRLGQHLRRARGHSIIQACRQSRSKPIALIHRTWTRTGIPPRLSR